MLPSVASINAMQVKDYIQALTDENKVHVEKIGSGNWYWAWAGEEKREKEKVREGLERELARYVKSVEDMDAKIAELKKGIERERREGDGAEAEERERMELMGEKARLEGEVGLLEGELQRFMAVDGAAGVERKESDIREWKAGAETWTDNIYVLEEYLKKLAGGDREILEAVRRECYGDEYVEGEGLRELEL